MILPIGLDGIKAYLRSFYTIKGKIKVFEFT